MTVFQRLAGCDTAGQSTIRLYDSIILRSRHYKKCGYYFDKVKWVHLYKQEGIEKGISHPGVFWKRSVPEKSRKVFFVQQSISGKSVRSEEMDAMDC